MTPASAPAVTSPLAGFLDDGELVRRVRRGDQRPFETRYERYREPLHRCCHSIVRQREDAEEAFQATMLVAFRALTAGRSASSPSAPGYTGSPTTPV